MASTAETRGADVWSGSSSNGYESKSCFLSWSFLAKVELAEPCE